MATANRRSVLFIAFGLIGIAAVVIGFLKTFILPSAGGTFKAPWQIYAHGIFAFAWVVLFLLQAILIRLKQLKGHRTLGYAALAIAVGAAVTLVPAGIIQVEKELAQGMGDTAVSGFLGIFTSGVLFLVLVFSGIYFRRQVEVHKWLMLLATLVLLWPAWFRFRHYFPEVPDPHIWFALVLADSWIAIALVWHYLATRKINKVLFFVGGFIIIEQTAEVILFDSPAWHAVAKALYSLAT